ncbi:6 kDa early secretory antigenic target [Corynebacterium kalinowskii]|uniref:ESAT-6-like protein n=1 Tax=Corynebacterium kalinowskii TaxID=2675216 RepID=A0A6B8VSF8_9CORY|nr:WXG100 family type VII secretion target [Corynebacterium kalinowskii]QGU02831.1 6 kDa early secretory antigenic target [Corynebacterium kalinowskii]
MESVIKYQFGEIEAAASDINSTSGRINALLDDLKAQLQPMVSTWEGEAAAAYGEAQTKWDKAAAELNTILATISKTVREGNDRMGDINRMAAASWG